MNIFKKFTILLITLLLLSAYQSKGRFEKEIVIQKLEAMGYELISAEDLTDVYPSKIIKIYERLDFVKGTRAFSVDLMTFKDSKTAISNEALDIQNQYTKKTYSSQNSRGVGGYI